MHWIIFAVIGVIATTVANLFQKIAMRDEKSDPVTSSIYFQFLMGTLASFFALLRGFSFPESYLVPYFLGSGILYAVGTICFFRAIKTIEASEMTILGGSGVVFTIFASMVFLGDKLNFIQLSGTALILCAIVIISWQKNVIKINIGMWLALAGAASYGLAVVFDSFIVKRYSAISFLPIASFVPGLLMVFFYHKRFSEVIKGISKINKNLIIFCIIYSCSSVAFYLGLENGALVGQMSTIFRASIVLTLISASLYLHETKHMGKKVIGAILTTIGVLLVS